MAALSRAEKLGSGRPEDVKHPVFCLLEYNDGFRAAVLMLGGLVNEYLVAFRVKGRPAIDSTSTATFPQRIRITSACWCMASRKCIRLASPRTRWSERC